MQSVEPVNIKVFAPPSAHPDADEIREKRKREFARVNAHEEACSLIRVDVRTSGPIGILHFGDPHLDDPGTDLAKMERHMDLIKATPGMLAANVGDSRNNWVGRLARLYAEQSTSAAESRILLEWFLKDLAGRWLYLVGGNHDCWSGADDPTPWLASHMGALFEPAQARIGLHFPNGREVIVNARHDFPGFSQWNAGHGVMKEAQLGVRDDVIICGHKHISAYSPVKDPAGNRVCHCIQVGSYKAHDRYAKEKGLRGKMLSPCVVTIIDPEATDPLELVDVDFHPERAAEKLQALRRKRGCK